MKAQGEIWIAFALAIGATGLGALLSLRLAGTSTKLGEGCELVPVGQVQTINADESDRRDPDDQRWAPGVRQPVIEARAEHAADAAGEETEDRQDKGSGSADAAEPETEEGKLSQDQIEKRKEELSAEQNYVCFMKGTEPPFSGKYYDNHEHGMYVCVVCNNPLFASDTKFDSGTGWPSFWEMAEEGHVAKHEDRSHGMLRTEVTCARCGSHLGHVFDDGPEPTGLRYCINSLSLDFIAADEWSQREAGQEAEEPSGDK